MQAERQVFINADARYGVALAVVIHSLLRHNDPTKPIVVHLAHDADFAQSDCRAQLERIAAQFPFARVEFHDFTPVFRQHEAELAPVEGNPWPPMVWAFPLFTELLPDIAGNVVYLDADMQVRKDLGELFDLDLKSGGWLAAAVDESPRAERVFLEQVGWPKDAGDYFNNGTMVVDADAYRREGIAAQIPPLFAAHRREFYGVDQDLQNVVFGTRTLRLPMKWNYHDTWLKKSVKLDLSAAKWDCHRPIDVLEAVVDPAIVHYVGRFKPWNANHRPERGPYRAEMKELGLLSSGRLPGETALSRIGGIFYDALHAILKVRARARLRRQRSVLSLPQSKNCRPSRKRKNASR